MVIAMRTRTRQLGEARPQQPSSAVDDERNAVDIACCVGREKQRGVLDIRDPSKASERNLSYQFFF